jgi:DNA-binding SARP family transcriptional activator/class 3 adenylate cyclase/WD40 repeat protein
MAVVFSDIVGSTALRNRLGEVAFTTLREAHDALAADLVEACSGQVVRWQGDGLVVAFSSAGQALEYASLLQPSMDRLAESDASFELRVGIGLGDVLNETTGDFDGPAFVDAARLCDAAEPRQVLCTDIVSRASRAYTADDFGPAVEMELKGLGAVEVREFLRRGTPTATSGLTVAVLGSLRAERGGRELDIGGPKERRVLSVLAAASGNAVGVDELIEALWASDPPRTAERSVQAYVARLRKVLEPSRNRGAPPRVIVNDGRGYRLALSRDALDSTRFEHLTTTAHEQLAAGHALRARGALDEALSLWRGSPFADHFDAERCASEARRLEEIRRLALEDRTTARLSLGEAAELVPELETLVTEHPLQERLWANLMIALYRSGRQSDALRTFQRARTALVDELGVEPGHELRRLEAAILEHDPALLTDSPAGGAPSRRLPAVLDPGGTALVGRDAELGLLRAAWERAFAGRGEFVAVVGPDGVGKTRLVAELAVEAYDAGAMILHARCDAADRGPEPLFDRALRGAGAQFSDAPDADGATPGAALAQFLAGWGGGRPVLLVLDDLHHGDTATVAALADLAEWSASAPLLVVATFRPDEDDGLESGQGRIALRALSRDGVGTIAQMYRDDWSATEIEELAAVTRGLPLAVHRVASEWAQEATRRQVHVATERATEARVRLVATRGDLADGIEGLQRLIEQRQVQLAPLATDAGGAPRVPYRGLEAFDRDDADLYFGRDRLLVELVTRVASAPIVVVVGASGSGKSSLVRAGLLPALATDMVWDRGAWSSTIVTPGSDPIGALAAVPAASDFEHHVVVVDPLEELWTACDDPSIRQAFCDSLVGMSEDARFTLVVCVRADFVDRVADHPTLAALVSANTLLVPPMTSDEFRRVVEGPAQRTGLSVEPQLVEAVVADVEGRPGALPLLSTALLATWERREARTLTLDGYRAAGGVASAIASMADSCYESLSPAPQRAARRVMLHLSGEENGVDVRRRVPLASLGAEDDPDVRTALDALVARRLVIVDHEVAEVAHEALLRDWPRLVAWLDEDRSGRRVHQRLATAAAAWSDGGRDPSQLYRGTQLDGAVEWASEHSDDFVPLERDFLDASREAAAFELESAQHRARVETKRNRRLRGALVGIAVLLVVALVAAGVAVQQGSEARSSESRAELEARFRAASRLAGQSAALPPSQFERRLLLATEAHRLAPGPETDWALFSALTAEPPDESRALRFDPPMAFGGAISPDGSLAAGAEVNGSTVHVFDVATGEQVRRFDTNPDGAVTVTLFSPDGRWIAVGSTGGEVTVWDVAKGRRVAGPLDAGDGVTYGIFDPTKRTRLFVPGQDGTIALWELDDPDRPVRRVLASTSPASTPNSPVLLLPAGDGRRVVVGDINPDRGIPVLVLDASTGAEVARFDGSPGAISRDGGLVALTAIASGVGAREVRVVDVASGDVMSAPIRSVSQPSAVMALDAAGERLAVIDQADQGRVHVVDWRTGLEIRAPIDVPGIDLAQFLADGTLYVRNETYAALVSLPASGSAAGEPYLTPIAHKFAPTGGGFEFTADNRFAITTPNSVVVADLDGSNSTEFPIPARASGGGLSVSPDLRTLLKGTPDGIEMIDRASGRSLGSFAGPRAGAAWGWNLDSSAVALQYRTGEVYLWPRGRSRPVQLALPVQLPPTPASAEPLLAFRPDGREIVVPFGGGVRAAIFEVPSGRRRAVVRLGDDVRVRGGFAYRPDGRRLAMTTVDNRTGATSIVVVDATSGAVIDEHQTDEDLFGIGYVGGGRRLATIGDARADAGSQTTTLEIWDADGLFPIGAGIQLPGTLDGLSASPAGTHVLISGGQGFVSWDLRPSRWVEEACKLAGRPLRRAEWQRYLPNTRYDPVCR